MAGGWVKVYREFTSWEWYSDVNVSRVFFHLLLTVNHKETKWQGQIIKPGEKVTSWQHLADETGLSVQNVRTAIVKLKSTGEITSRSTNKFTVISIVNWRKYQDEGFPDNEVNNNQNNKRATNGQQATNKQLTTNKNEKNDKNEKNIDISSVEDAPIIPLPAEAKEKKPKKHKYGEHKNVLLTDDEVEKLKARFGSSYLEKIEKLSNGIALKGYKYKSHYLALLSWFKDEAPDKVEDDIIIQNMYVVPTFGGGYE